MGLAVFGSRVYQFTSSSFPSSACSSRINKASPYNMLCLINHSLIVAGGFYSNIVNAPNSIHPKKLSKHFSYSTSISKYTTETWDSCPFKGFASISNSFNLKRHTKLLETVLRLQMKMLRVRLHCRPSMLLMLTERKINMWVAVAARVLAESEIPGWHNEAIKAGFVL